MNIVNQFENRASRSRGTHEGKSSTALCDRPSRTRDSRPRQLPTDHDHAVPTRAYQTDQSSPILLRLLLALSSKKQKPPTAVQALTGSLHIRADGKAVPDFFFKAGKQESGALRSTLSFPCSLGPSFPRSVVPFLTANVPQSAPIRHGDAPNGARPTPLRGAADAPSTHAPTHTARHPSDDSPRSTHSRGAAAAHNAPRWAPAARRAPQPQPALWQPQASEREPTAKQAQSFSLQIPTSSRIHRTRS